MDEKTVNGVLYKVGDEVVILNGLDNKWGGRIASSEHEDGVTIYDITHITDKGFIVGETSVRFGWWVDFDNVRHASKFRPGDTIIMTADSPYGITTPGAIGVIEYIHDTAVGVTFRRDTLTNHPDEWSNDYTVDIKYIKHYTESETRMPKTEFKPGDKVRVLTGDWSLGTRITDGDIGVVASGPFVASGSDADDADLRVKFADNWFYVPRSFMTHVDSNTSVNVVDMVADIKALVDKYGAENVKRTVKFLSKV